MATTGSTLLELRTGLRRFLNEPSVGFWSNADLDAYIQQACNKYYSIYESRVPTFGRIAYDITYPASAESYTITETDWQFREALRLEDRTDQQPGVVIPFTNSIDGILSAGNIGMQENLLGIPTLAYIEHEQEISGGVVNNKLVLWLAPKPNSSRTLRLHIRALPTNISGGDTNTSGLPSVFDTPIILQAALYARLQEQNSEVGPLSVELERAENFLYSQIRPYAREADKVEFAGDD